MAVMRNIDCQIMSVPSLANDISAPSPKPRAASAVASWISSEMRISRKRRLTSGASVRLPGVVGPRLERRIATVVNCLHVLGHMAPILVGTKAEPVAHSMDCKKALSERILNAEIDDHLAGESAAGEIGRIFAMHRRGKRGFTWIRQRPPTPSCPRPRREQ